MASAARNGPASLSVRLHAWALSRGWRLRIAIDRSAAEEERVIATVGPVTAVGRTAGEAVERLAREIVVEGWRDEGPEALAS